MVARQLSRLLLFLFGRSFFVFIIKALKFLCLLRHGPRLNFTGPQHTVEDCAECIDSCSEVEHQSPRLDCLLQQKTVWLTL